MKENSHSLLEGRDSWPHSGRLPPLSSTKMKEGLSNVSILVLGDGKCRQLPICASDSLKILS